MIGFYNYTVWLTYLSLISSGSGIVFCFVFKDKPIIAIICLLFSGFCDMFDGMVARTKKNRTEDEKQYGIQIDSLTDLICFGVLPCSILYSLINNCIEGYYKLLFIPLALIFMLFGMIRLAYFNVLEIKRQQTEKSPVNSHYLGMPITLSALFLPIAYFIGDIINTKYSILIVYSIIMLIVGILFVVKIKVPKIKKRGLIVLVIFGAILLTGIITLEILK